MPEHTGMEPLMDLNRCSDKNVAPDQAWSDGEIRLYEGVLQDSTRVREQAHSVTAETILEAILHVTQAVGALDARC